MAKYDPLLGDLKTQIASASKILVALPASLTLDSLAAGLALFLSIKQSGKEASVVSSDSIKVSHSNLFGVNQIKSEMPKVSASNLTLTLEGVVASDGSVPALEKLDWFPEGENLNLVFHVLPGQKFEPKRIVPKVSGGSGFDMTFVIGSSTLEGLGALYTSNTQAFGGKVINIDNSGNNTKYGSLALVDPEAVTLSEMIASVLQGLGLPFDTDIASNILAGIYGSTQNLTVGVKADTFILAGQMMQFGGKIPGAPAGVTPIQSVPPQPTPAVQPQAAQPSQPQVQPSAPSTPAQEYNQNFPPLNQVFGFPVQPEPTAVPAPVVPQATTDNFTVPPVINTQPQAQVPSSEERPMGEYAGSSNPEISNPDPDWLTPKVYKGTNIG